MGGGQPFSGRLRVSTQLTYRSSTHGTAAQAERIDEGIIGVAAAYTPWEWLVVSATVPLVLKRLRHANLAEDRSFGPGETTLRGRFVLLDRRAAGRHLAGVGGGLRMPTAIRQRGVDGAPLPLDAQASSGAWVPLADLWYRYFHLPWSVYLSSTLQVPTPGWDGYRSGIAWLTSSVAQYQAWSWLALRLGVDTRWATADRDAEGAEPDSGGFVGYLSPALVTSPLMDLVVYATVRVPVLQALRGAQRESLQALVGAAYDL